MRRPDRKPVPLYCLLSTAHCLFPTAYCLLPTACCLLPTAYCLLPAAYCLLPTAHFLPVPLVASGPGSIGGVSIYACIHAHTHAHLS